MSSGGNLNILLITTYQCNLACRYCYINPDKKVCMDLASFQSIIQTLDHYFAPEIDFQIVFHGGEPLLLGETFYNAAFRFLQELTHRKIHTAVQTNLTLLTPEYTDLFQKYNCTIGTSIDGAKEMHDQNRIQKSGAGSFDKVISNLSILQALGKSYGLIVTLNNQNTSDPAYLYQTLRQFKNDPIGFSIVYLNESESDFKISSEQLGDRLIRLFDIWAADPTPLNLTWFQNIVRCCLGQNNASLCTFSGKCIDHFLAIDPFGNVFPCCDFAGRNDMSYGNIFRQDFREIWNSPMRQRLSFRNTVLTRDESCRDCDVFTICHGGCMAKSDDPFRKKDYYCLAYRMLFHHVQWVLKENIEKAEQSL